MKYLRNARLVACTVALAWACGIDAQVFAETGQAAPSTKTHVSDWVTHNGNASHTGYVPVFTHAPDFRVRWTAKLPASDRGYNPAATGGGQAYVSDQVWFTTGHFYALDIFTGKPVWTHEYTSPIYGGIPIMNAPAYKNGMAYVSTGGHEDAALWGYDSATGEQKFRAQIDAQWETYYAPTPYGESMYMNGGYYGGAYAFQSRSGQSRWFTPLPQYDHWSPAVDDEYVYAYTTELDLIDRKTGRLAMTIPDPNFNWWGYSVGCAPVLGSLHDVLVTQASRMVSFDLNQRKVAWEVPVTTGYYTLNQLSLADGLIYYGNGNNVQIRDESDGHLVATWTVPDGGTVESTVILTRNLFFVSTSNGTYAVSRDTASGFRWHSKSHGQISLSREGMLVIVGGDGTVTGVQVRKHDFQ